MLLRDHYKTLEDTMRLFALSGKQSHSDDEMGTDLVPVHPAWFGGMAV